MSPSLGCSPSCLCRRSPGARPRRASEGQASHNVKVTKPRQFLGPTVVCCVVLDLLQVVMPVIEWDNRHASYPTFQCLPHFSQAPSSCDGVKHVVRCNFNILKVLKVPCTVSLLWGRRGYQAETSSGPWHLTPSDRLHTTSPQACQYIVHQSLGTAHGDEILCP